MLRKLSIPIIAAVLLLATMLPAFAQERSGNNIIGPITQAPIVSNGLLTGEFPDFVINYDVNMDPAVAGRTLLEGKQIRITMPPEFTVSGTPTPQDPFDSSNPFGAKSWAALLQGWPQVPIFSSFPPGDLSGDIRYTISMSGTHTMIVTANQDLDGSLSFVPPSPDGPGIKQIHILFAHLVNPAAGSYEVMVESETGPNGALEVGSSTIEIADAQQPAIAFTSVFNQPFRKNGIYQEVKTGDFLENPLHLFAWNAGGEPLSGAYLEYTSDTTADLMVDVPEEPRAPQKVGTVTMTFPANSVGGGVFTNLSPVDIPAPISGMTTTHLTVDYVAGSEPGMATVEFALDGGNSVTAFINVVPRSLDDPGTRTWHGMDYDPVNDIAYLTGGRNHGCPCITYDEVWAYNVGQETWERKADFANQLPEFANMDMNAYDTESEQLVILAQGIHTDVVPLIYTPATNTLVEGGKDNLPSDRFESGLVYHPVSDRIVMFGGTNFGDTLADTWLYDTNSDTWTELTTNGTPPSRARFAMVYDSDADRIIIYGGGHGFLFSGQYRSDTWEFDVATSTWTEIVTAVKPEMQEQVDGAYDSQSKKFILYGLSVAGAYETWAFDYPTKTWTLLHTVEEIAEERHPSGFNGPRSHHAGEMVYSPLRDRVMLYGGNINWHESAVASDLLWGFDFETASWLPQPTAIELSAETTPSSNIPIALALLLTIMISSSVAVIYRRKQSHN